MKLAAPAWAGRKLWLMLVASAACAHPGARPETAGPVPAAPVAAETAASADVAAAAAGKRCRQLHEAERWTDAEACFRRIVAERPRDARAHLWLGLVLMAEERTDDAIASLRASLAIVDDALVRFNLALNLANRRDVPGALEQLGKAVALRPDYPKAWYVTVDLLARSELAEESVIAVEAARRFCPSCAGDEACRRQRGMLVLYHRERAHKELEAGALAEARRHAEWVLRLQPGFADAHYDLGLIARAAGDRVTAEAEYRAAIAAYPESQADDAADARNNLAFLLLAKPGAALEAVAAVRAAIAVRGERPAYLDTLARACDAVPDRACALAAYEKLLAAGAEALPAEVRAHAGERARELRLKAGRAPPTPR
jgi:tetratricopeptide (TPR) repeat protein